MLNHRSTVNLLSLIIVLNIPGCQSSGRIELASHEESQVIVDDPQGTISDLSSPSRAASLPEDNRAPSLPGNAEIDAPLDKALNVFFQHGSAELDADGRTLLGEHARYLNEHRRKFLVLRAYTNDLGSRSLNTAVADRRLGAIKRFLLAKGVKRGQIRLQSSGGETPTQRCLSEACRQRWQRVELQFR